MCFPDICSGCLHAFLCPMIDYLLVLILVLLILWWQPHDVMHILLLAFSTTALPCSSSCFSSHSILPPVILRFIFLYHIFFSFKKLIILNRSDSQEDMPYEYKANMVYTVRRCLKRTNKNNEGMKESILKPCITSFAPHLREVCITYFSLSVKMCHHLVSLFWPSHA